MTEAEARATVEQIVGTTATHLLDRFNDLLVSENDRQNLVARSTIPVIWHRHILDSVQLLQWAGKGEGRWIDIGTGGGFPGVIIAIIRPAPIVLVEPRRRRAEFLSALIDNLGLGHATVVADRVERMPTAIATTISARAVAPIETLLANANGHATMATTWILPRGAGWSDDVMRAKRQWKATFHVEQSLSDPAAGIVIATGVCRR